MVVKLILALTLLLPAISYSQSNELESFEIIGDASDSDSTVITFWEIQYIALSKLIVDFKADAMRYGKVFTKEDPILIITEGPIYVKNKAVAAFVDHDDGTIHFDTLSTPYIYNFKVLVYHELGHYYLNRWHRDSTFPNSDIPRSLMETNCTIEWDKLTLEMKEAYLEELFTGKN